MNTMHSLARLGTRAGCFMSAEPDQILSFFRVMEGSGGRLVPPWRRRGSPFPQLAFLTCFCQRLGRQYFPCSMVEILHCAESTSGRYLIQNLAGARCPTHLRSQRSPILSRLIQRAMRWSLNARSCRRLCKRLILPQAKQLHVKIA